MTYPPETVAGLLKVREDWLRVMAIPSKHGGIDVVLVIDGSYSLDRYDPSELEREWDARIRAAFATDGLPLGVPLKDCPGRATVLGGEPDPTEPERPLTSVADAVNELLADLRNRRGGDHG
ncbi:hypothetical protein [Nonomuraea sp. NPDC050310]|uniref:hypothetical protein n=1 Tax=Nonomuraea sp. NPDC050310 TaxID=3154935 RepID=UPI0033E93B39